MPASFFVRTLLFHSSKDLNKVNFIDYMSTVHNDNGIVLCKCSIFLIDFTYFMDRI